MIDKEKNLVDLFVDMIISIITIMIMYGTTDVRAKAADWNHIYIYSLWPLFLPILLISVYQNLNEIGQKKFSGSINIIGINAQIRTLILFISFIFPISFGGYSILIEGAAGLASLRSEPTAIFINRAEFKSINMLSKSTGILLSYCMTNDDDIIFLKSAKILWGGPGQFYLVEIRNNQEYVNIEIDKNNARIINASLIPINCQ